MERKDVSLLKRKDDRGGFEIWVAGEMWAIARARWAGCHGLSHLLQYPDGKDITEVLSSPTKTEPNRTFETKARVDSQSRRQRQDFKAKPESQAEAVKTKFLALVEAGRIKTPAELEAARKDRADKYAAMRTAAQDHRARMMAGVVSLRDRRDLEPLEREALRYLYREAFAAPMREKGEL